MEELLILNYFIAHIYKAFYFYIYDIFGLILKRLHKFFTLNCVYMYQKAYKTTYIHKYILSKEARLKNVLFICVFYCKYSL